MRSPPLSLSFSPVATMAFQEDNVQVPFPSGVANSGQDPWDGVLEDLEDLCGLVVNANAAVPFELFEERLCSDGSLESRKQWDPYSLPDFYPHEPFSGAPVVQCIGSVAETCAAVQFPTCPDVPSEHSPNVNIHATPPPEPSYSNIIAFESEVFDRGRVEGSSRSPPPSSEPRASPKPKMRRLDEPPRNLACHFCRLRKIRCRPEEDTDACMECRRRRQRCVFPECSYRGARNDLKRKKKTHSKGARLQVSSVPAVDSSAAHERRARPRRAKM
ncbi:hypothetical protein OF83DRAFT_1113670 [Amylostereum chailletii]|nr:hypothetical protein OF83DRAFT_1113670 [Amylostereum chailletii]